MMNCRRQCGLIFGIVCLFIAPAMTSLAADPPKLDFARWEKTISKFEAEDQVSPQKPGQIVFVGSSSIVRWNLPESFPGLDAINRGFGGSLLADTVHFFDRVVVPYQPRTIVVYAGDNDLARGFDADFVVDQFRQLLAKRAKALPKSKLIFIGIKPSISRWKLIEQVRKANADIKDICEKTPNTVYLDVDTPMIGEDGTLSPKWFVKDGLHLSPEGYQLWNDLLRPHISGDARLGPKRGIYDRYHPWTPPATLAEWEVEQERIRRQLQVACGLWPMPEKTELNPVLHGRIDFGDYTAEKVYFTSLPGHYVSGMLYRPKNVEGKIPAVLCPHGHWTEGRFQDAGAGAEAELKSGAEKYLSGARFPVQARAVQLARMGAVAFVYDMIGNADSGVLHHRQGFSDAQASLWLHNKLGLQTWNSIRALDFLTALPEVDEKRLGVTGESGGGTQTMLVCAIDPRPAVSFPAVMVSTGMQGGCICENCDLLRLGINNIAIAAAFAPKPQAMSGANDWTILIEKRGLPELKHVYGLHGEEENVEAKAFPQFPHNYNQVAREMMFDWFNEHLKMNQQTPVQQTDFWPLTRQQQIVFDEQHPRPADTLDEAGLRKQLVERDQRWLKTGIEKADGKVQEVIRPAVEIMFPVAKGDLSVDSVSKEANANGDSIQKLIITSGQFHVPATLIQPATPSKKVVLWLDGAGASHLLTENGSPEPAVQTLLDKGFAVASADLLLTGSTANEVNPYLEKLKTISPSHQTSVPGEDYTGFLYGYNLPLLSERVNDIDRIIQALQLHGFTEIRLAGTTEAGLWALLARARWQPETVVQTVVDLNGFRFGAIQSSLDMNLVPGALKYGGVGGISSLAFPARLTVAGAGNLEDAELSPLRRRYADNKNLTLSDKPITRTDVATAIAQ